MPLIVIKKPEPPNPEKVYEATKRFEWLVTFMICRFKFIHAMMGMMVKIPSNIETMGVAVIDGKIQLHYNPVWTMELTDAQLTYVFYHEILHLALHHCTRRPLATDIKDKRLANIAHDLAVNELIPENDACKKPVGPDGKPMGCFVCEFKKQKEFADIQERQTAEWYYDYLLEKRKEYPNLGGGGFDKPYLGGSFDDHDQWGEHELADEKVTTKVGDIDQRELWGDLTAGEREIILAAQIRKVNWRNYIRNWFGQQAWRDRISTRKKPNRRTGMIHPGYKRAYVDRWLVTGDTSGSCRSYLGEYISVLNQLADTLPIDFAQCDAAITEMPHPYDRRRDQVEFKGLGGTSFQPIIDLVDKYHYRGVMILTDGEAPAPTKPKNAKVLWVLPPNHNPPVEWGDRVHLQRHV